MHFLIRYLLNFLTTPGLLLRAFVIKRVCENLGVKIEEVKYLAFTEEEESVEIRELPEHYHKTLQLVVLPFVLLSLFAYGLFYVAVQLPDALEILVVWLGVSAAAHSLPSFSYGDMLWYTSKTAVKARNMLGLLGLLVSALVFVIRIFRFVYLDVLYGVFMYLHVAGDLPA